jgi:hypothetical protein
MEMLPANYDAWRLSSDTDELEDTSEYDRYEDDPDFADKTFAVGYLYLRDP